MAPWSEILAEMFHERWFWGLLTLTVLVWYSTVTVYVAVKGVGNIRSMLRTLKGRGTGTGEGDPEPRVQPPSAEGERQ